jgi:hypothetical protein
LRDAANISFFIDENIVGDFRLLRMKNMEITGQNSISSSNGNLGKRLPG